MTDDKEKTVRELLALAFDQEAPQQDLAAPVLRRVAKIRTAMEMGRLIFRSPFAPAQTTPEPTAIENTTADDKPEEDNNE